MDVGRFFTDVRQAVANLAAQPAPTYGGLQTQPATSVPATLDEQVQTTLDASGNGTVSITPPGPRISGAVWNVSNVYVSVATHIAEAQATLYVSRGIQSAAPTDSIGQTATASSGDSYTNAIDLRPGDWITCKWAGGDANSTATLTVKGQVTLQS